MGDTWPGPTARAQPLRAEAFRSSRPRPGVNEQFDVEHAPCVDEFPKEKPLVFDIDVSWDP